MSGLYRWSKRGAWAVLDQGLFALTNFVVSIWLARVLSRADYGLFALGYTLLLLVGAFFLGLLGEPISVFGSGKYRDRFGEYLAATLVGWLLGAVFLTLLFAAGATVLSLTDAAEFAEVALVVGLVAPLVALLRTLRMCSYACWRPHLAALASAIHLLAVLAVIVLVPGVAVSPTAGFLALAVGVIPAAAILLRALALKAPWTVSREFYGQVYRDHIGFGRWSVGANLLLWVPGNAVYFLLTSWSGVEATGVLKALRTLTTPILHAVQALTSVLMPKLVQARGTPLHRRVLRMGMFAFVSVALAYWLAIVVAGRPLLTLAFAGGYDSFSAHLSVLAFGPVIGAVVAVLGATLRSMERPRDVFVGNAVAAFCTLTVGATLIGHLQLVGAIITVVATPAAAALTLALLKRRSHAAA